jgi:ABC-type polysaccharide/polyol phosphate export permease
MVKVRIKQILGLSLALAKAQFKTKNEGSYLGVFWYLLNPLLMFALLYLVFSTRIGQDILHYPLYLLLGIIMFNFFHNVTVESTETIRERAVIVKSINFPKESLIGSIVLKTLFSHIFEMIIFVLFLLFFGISLKTMIFYPIVLVFFCLFAWGSALILSAVSVYFIDIENIWIFVSRLIWFATPIFYAIEGQTRLLIFNLFNPMYYFITIARDLIIYNRIPHIFLIEGAIIYTLLSFFIGLFIFHKLKKRFAELI